MAGPLAGEPGILAPLAGPTIVAGGQCIKIHLPDAVVPNVDHGERAVDRLAIAAQQLDRFGRLQRGDDIDDGGQDAGGVAGGRGARWWRVIHQAAETRGLARHDGHRLTLAAEAAAVDPWDSALQCNVVEQHARFEVVGAVEDDVDAVGQFHDVGIVDVGYQRLDGDLGIDFGELRGGGNRLGQLGGDVLFVEQDLPLEVVCFQKIAIHDAQVAHAAAGQRARDHRAERPTTADQDPSCQQPALSFFADRRVAHLAHIAVKVLWGSRLLIHAV